MADIKRTKRQIVDRIHKLPDTKANKLVLYQIARLVNVHIDDHPTSRRAVSEG